MKNRLTAFLIFLISLFCISCDFSIADLLNEQMDLTPPIYLSYKTQYGKAPSRVKITKGDVITDTMLPTVTYEYDSSSYYYYDGYYYYDDGEERSFEGWYYDDNYENKAQEGDVLDGNVTLYAKWVSAYVYVYFNSDYGNYDKSVRVKIGTKLSSDNYLYTPYYYNDSYQFKGWYLSSGESADGYIVTSDTFLYAIWDYRYYNIHYYLSSDYNFRNTTIDKNSSLTSEYLRSPDYYGYGYTDKQFLGWYYDSAYEHEACVGDSVNDDIYLYAKWKETIHIYYDANGYTSSPDYQTLQDGGLLTTENLPEISPYSWYNYMRFVGWYYDLNYERQALAGDIVTESITLYAKWEELPTGRFEEFWIFDADISDDYVRYDQYTQPWGDVWNWPEDFPSKYRNVGEDFVTYDTYEYNGTTYYNAYVAKSLYCNTEVKSYNLEKLLSNTPLLPTPETNTLWITITDSVPEIESVANAIKNYNNGNYIDLNLSECTGLTEIPDSCFMSCTYLKSITLPRALQTIGDYAFKWCSSMYSAGVIWQNLTSIGEGAFTYTGLTEIELHRCNNLTTLPNDLFAGCSSLERISLPESIQTIGNNTFQSCVALGSISIPSNVTQIGARAFNDCQGLTEIEIPEGVTTISQYCFYNSSALRKVIIPSTVTYIDYFAFENCPIETVNFRGTTLQKDGITNYDTTIFSVDWNCNYSN